jgi:hypothetical protein
MCDYGIVVCHGNSGDVYGCDARRIDRAAADSLEAAEKRIAELSLDNKMLKNTIDADKGVMLDRIRYLEAQLPKDGDRISKWDIALLNTFDNDRHNLLARCKCIKCGKDITVLATNIPNYCPDCGARMKGGQE